MLFFDSGDIFRLSKYIHKHQPFAGLGLKSLYLLIHLYFHRILDLTSLKNFWNLAKSQII